MGFSSDVVLKTIHGSRLYGLDNAFSDYDYYVVVSDSQRKDRQSITGDVDVNMVGFDSFLEKCFKGVPQALEAMFSRSATVDVFDSLRRSYKAGGSSVVDTYMRTIYSFSKDERSGGLRYKKHAARLTLNFNSLLMHEKFNPALSVEEKKIVNSLFMLGQDDFECEINKLSLVEIF